MFEQRAPNDPEATSLTMNFYSSFGRCLSSLVPNFTFIVFLT